MKNTVKHALLRMNMHQEFFGVNLFGIGVQKCDFVQESDDKQKTRARAFFRSGVEFRFFFGKTQIWSLEPKSALEAV